MTTLYDFTPTEDLTVQELASIMRSLFVALIEGIQGQDVTGNDALQIDDVIFDILAEDLKRHFTKLDTTELEQEQFAGGNIYDHCSYHWDGQTGTSSSTLILLR